MKNVQLHRTEQRDIPTLIFLMTLYVFPLQVQGQGLEGITIIELTRQGDDFVATGDFLVTFIDGDQTFATVAHEQPANEYSGCTSLGVPKSYDDGNSIAFGIDAPLEARKQRLEKYCPLFSVTRQNEDMVEISVPSGESVSANIISHIPLQGRDFQTSLLNRMDIRGVSLGPVQNEEYLKGLSAKGYGDNARGYQRLVETAEAPTNILGEVAASEITGWPQPVMYYMQLLEQFPIPTTLENFYAAVVDRYGEPTVRYKNEHNMFWVYDLDGNQVNMDDTPMSNPCRKTIDYRVNYDLLGRPQRVELERNDFDVGPWGCSLIMEINANLSSTGVTGYSTRQLHGYVKGMNHFYNSIDEAEDLKENVEALINSRPAF